MDTKNVPSINVEETEESTSSTCSTSNCQVELVDSSVSSTLILGTFFCIHFNIF